MAISGEGLLRRTQDLKARRDLYRAPLPVIHNRDFCMFIRRTVSMKSPRSSRGSSLGIKQLMIFKTMYNVLKMTFIQTLRNKCSRGVKQYQSINRSTCRVMPNHRDNGQNERRAWRATVVLWISSLITEGPLKQCKIVTTSIHLRKSFLLDRKYCYKEISRMAAVIYFKKSDRNEIFIQR